MSAVEAIKALVGILSKNSTPVTKAQEQELLAILEPEPPVLESVAEEPEQEPEQELAKDAPAKPSRKKATPVSE